MLWLLQIFMEPLFHTSVQVFKVDNSGITGGVGMTPGACIGKDHALFSQGMPHSGMTIAGKNIANPTSMLLSSVLMLRYLGLPRFADQISNAVNEVLEEGNNKTRDIGGVTSTSDFTKAVIHHLWENRLYFYFIFKPFVFVLKLHSIKTGDV